MLDWVGCNSSNRGLSFEEAEKETQSHRGEGGMKMETEIGEVQLSQGMPGIAGHPASRGDLWGGILHQNFQREPTLQTL